MRKDGKTALIPAAGLTRRRPVCGRTQRPLLEGRRHRGTDPPAPLGEAGVQKNDGTAAIHIATFLEDAALVRMLCPYKKELQLADGRTAHMIAAALNNPALHAVFAEPKRTRARSRAQGSTRGR